MIALSEHAVQSFQRATIRSVILIGILCAAATLYAQPLDWDALNQGRVITEHIKDPQGVFGVRAQFLVKAQRGEIWKTFTDYKSFPLLYDDIKEIKLLDSDEKGAHIEIVANAVIMDLTYVLYREYRHPQHELLWNRVSGDLKVVHGSWRILDAPSAGSKLLVYESFVDTGTPILTWLMKLGYRQKVEAMAIRLREWIEQKKLEAS